MEVFPLLNLLGNESLGVGGLSYAGQFNMMAVADRDAYPDLSVLANGVRHELDALARTSVKAGVRSLWATVSDPCAMATALG